MVLAVSGTMLAPRRAVSLGLFVIVSCLLPLTASAQQGATGPYAHLMRAPASTSLLGGGYNALTMAPFDPADPQTGIGLAVAYLPSPLMLLNVVAEDELSSRPFTIFELVMGVAGAAVAGWSIADAISRAEGADLSINAIAAAHAMSWNLELVTRAVLQMVLGTNDGPTFSSVMPTIMAFPVQGGAGISPHWTF